LLAWVFLVCILLSPIAVLWQIWELVGNAVGHARRGERFYAAMDAMGAGLWVAAAVFIGYVVANLLSIDLPPVFDPLPGGRR
jgi:hypothetical protein